LAVFAAYSIETNLGITQPLSTTKAFTSFALITLLTQPAAMLLQTFPSVISTKGCFDRIQVFLLDADFKEDRLSSSMDSEYEDKTSQSKINTDIQSLQIELAVSELDLHTPANRDGDKNLISFNILRGTIWMISGPVGSGKTTILRLILGEIPNTGKITIRSPHYGYCSQSPWILNRSIKENILGSNDYDESWYHHVSYVCDLDLDISKMPNKDDSKVGSRGHSISGGQNHRIVSKLITIMERE
jgi:ABC-type bacteriocin/lantibiotic exporter with double-glycine peptidase domain